MDLALISLSHVLLLPLWLLLWTIIPLLIWLEDRGPVLFRQQRSGKNGKPFVILKFRTMVVGADKQGPAWSLERDLRVTRVGRILRWTAMDELPGLLNILRGDMSLVGPRALPLTEQRWLEQRIPRFADRLHIRPGLTGLAQVYDHADEAETKLRYDLEYAQRMSLWLDLKLLFLSVFFTLTGRWDRRSGKSTEGTDQWQ